ncbi:MAG: hypothetical protein IT424_06665 [Pirellulales bacterium]|nr:hypothetical protein [Pirellulales bacterium]
MDATTPQVPSPSLAWSRLATTLGGEPPAETPIDDGPCPSNRRVDEAAQLKARLLHLIEAHEHRRKAAATDAHVAR